jgi:hypothetical protein
MQNISENIKIDTSCLSFNNDKLSIKHNPYVYDGEKYLPLRYPDLSTQPSVLPYTFMGNYVYEQLLYLGKSREGHISKTFNLDDKPFKVNYPIILDVKGIGYAKPLLHDGEKHVFTDNYIGLPCDINVHWEDLDLNKQSNGGIVFTINEPKFKQTEKVIKNQRCKLIITYYAKIIYTESNF